MNARSTTVTTTDRRHDRRLEHTRFMPPLSLRDHDGDRASWIRGYAAWLADPQRTWALSAVDSLQGLTIACADSDGPSPAHVVALLADGVCSDPQKAAETVIEQYESNRSEQ